MKTWIQWSWRRRRGNERRQSRAACWWGRFCGDYCTTGYIIIKDGVKAPEWRNGTVEDGLLIARFRFQRVVPRNHSWLRARLRLLRGAKLYATSPHQICLFDYADALGAIFLELYSCEFEEVSGAALAIPVNPCDWNPSVTASLYLTCIATRDGGCHAATWKSGGCSAYQHWFKYARKPHSDYVHL